MGYSLYIVILLLTIIILSYIYEYYEKNKIRIKGIKVHDIVLVPVFILLTFLCILRSPVVGNDTYHYISIYSYIRDTQDGLKDLLMRYEPGYLYLNKVVSIFFSNPQSILIITGLITGIGYYSFIHKYSYSVILSIFMFICLRYYDQTLNIIRECIALCIILYSYRFICTKRFLLFLLSVVCATFFHKTSIVFLLAWWICKIKISSKNFGLLFIITLLLTFQFNTIFSSLITVVKVYSYYDGGQYFGETRLATIMNIIVNSFFFIIALKIRNIHGDKLSEHIDRMLLLWYIGICILFVSTQFNLLDRIATYYLVFSIVVYPNMISLLVRNKIRYQWTILSIIILLTYYSTIIFYRPMWNRIFPYEFF